MYRKGKGASPLRVWLQGNDYNDQWGGPGGIFVLHGDGLHGNPYDGHTLGDVLKETGPLTGVTPHRVYVDKGYKGDKQDRSWFDPETRQDVCNPWKVYRSGRKGLKPHLKKELTR